MGRPLDRRAVDQLVVEHLPAALRMAMRMAGDPHVAEDVVQEALCRALKEWRTFRGDASFRTWLLQIVVNVDRDRRRRLRIAEPLDQNEILARMASPPALTEAAELSATIRGAIDALPHRQREIALLAWGEGL